jgi:hypothetical protein
MKEVVIFGIIFALLSFTFGIAFKVALHGSENIYKLSFFNFFKHIVTSGFYPMFGKMDVYDSYFSEKFFGGNYSRENCLNETNGDFLSCPYSDGIKFIFYLSIIYLIIMNLVFFNLIIALIG